MNLKSLLLPAVSMLAILAAGMAHGVFTSRWTSSSGLRVAAEQLADLPLKFGDWTAERTELSQSEREQTGTQGWYTVRLNRGGRREVASIMLLCGQTRPLSVHPPTVCFEGMGLELAAPTRRIQVSGTGDDESWGQFMVGDFRMIDQTTPQLRAYWAWSTDGRNWEAPEIPRFSFSSAPYLYKIYVTRRLDNSATAAGGSEAEAAPGRESTGSPDDNELCSQILREFLPELQKVIRPVE